jgi:hypothetical protein
MVILIRHQLTLLPFLDLLLHVPLEQPSFLPSPFRSTLSRLMNLLHVTVFSSSKQASHYTVEVVRQTWSGHECSPASINV